MYCEQRGLRSEGVFVMSGIILQILSVIGIVLLILLGFVLLLLMLLLFWPVTYRISGEKSPDKLMAAGRADWLFGVFKVRYAYPEPNAVTVRILWKTLVNTGQKKTELEAKQKPQSADEEHSGKEQKAQEDPFLKDQQPSGNGTVSENNIQTDKRQEQAEDEREASAPPELPPAKEENEDASAPFSRILKKFQNIKYTISGIYDKIKAIWANISYYNDLLHEENTFLLWKHVKYRLGKVLKNIRPRHLKARVIFGTGAPDTTGYCLGLYGILSPILGNEVCFLPDFDRAVLEGTFDVSGHITLCTLIWNTLKLLLDQKLRLFIKKMKAGRKENGR